jgi:hypothetical protein
MRPAVFKPENHAHNVHGLQGRQYSYRSCLIFHLASSISLLVSLCPCRSNLGRAGAHGDQSRGITAHLLALLGDAADVGAASHVPHGNVFLHAAGQAAALLGREGGTGGGNAGVVAVLVDFLSAN